MFGGRTDRDAETVVRLLAEQVRRDISFGVLPPDTRLKIEDLRSRYGGSAHSFREALTRLAGEGLVEANAQRGFRVASATEADARDIARLRARIETPGLDWALEHGDVAWEGALIAALHACARADEAVADAPMERALDWALDWDEAGRAFHAALVAPCRSPRLVAFQDSLFLQGRRFRLAALREGRAGPDAGPGAAPGAAPGTTRAALVEHILARRRAAALDALAGLILREAGQTPNCN